MPQNDKALLSRLKEQQVEFVIIGGVCGVLHGVSLVTLDLDICCRFSRDNLRRIEAAVKDLHPRHRLTANKLPLELTDELCGSLKNIYLNTDLGVLDCLSEVSGIGGYEQVLQRSIPHTMSYGEFRILNLDALIAAKSAAGREKDLDAVRLLQAIKEQKEQQKELF
jgi:predicted nucleotidyltransferase